MTQTAELTAPAAPLSLAAIATATPDEIARALVEVTGELARLTTERRAALHALASAYGDGDALATAAAHLAALEIAWRSADERRAALEDERPDAERRQLADERDEAGEKARALQAEADALAPAETEAEKRLNEIRADRRRLTDQAVEQHERWRDRMLALQRLNHD